LYRDAQVRRPGAERSLRVVHRRPESEYPRERESLLRADGSERQERVFPKNFPDSARAQSHVEQSIAAARHRPRWEFAKNLLHWIRRTTARPAPRVHRSKPALLACQPIGLDPVADTELADRLGEIIAHGSIGQV